MCVRTTSNEHHHSDYIPAIQRVLAFAVCPELQSKRNSDVQLESAAELPQASSDEIRAVGYGLANALGLIAAMRA
jgi:hypothetical protein